jgi:hypothetical protein
MYVAAMAATLGVLGGCGHGSSSPAVAQNAPLAVAADSSSSVSAGIESSLGTQAIDRFVPATGTEFALGARFDGIESALENIPTSRCMTGRGFRVRLPSAEQVAAGYVDNSEFPDLARISSTLRFIPDGAAGPPPTAPVPPAQMNGYMADLKLCSTSSTRIFAALDDAGSALQALWMNRVRMLESSPSVRATIPAFQSCLSAAGVPASEGLTAGSVSVSATSSSQQALGVFLAWESGQESQQKTEEGIFSVDAHWASVFVRCAGPVVRVVEQAQVAEKKKFLRDHYQDVNALVRLASQEVAQAEHQYGTPASG